MTQHRRYRALYDYEARDDKDLSMKTGDLLLVKQQPDGTWPSAENSKWMLGTNETTSQHGDFPGGDYVEFVEEYTPPKPPKPSIKPKPTRKGQNLRQTHIDHSKSELLQSCSVSKYSSTCSTRIPQSQLTCRRKSQQLCDGTDVMQPTFYQEQRRDTLDNMGRKDAWPKTGKAATLPRSASAFKTELDSVLAKIQPKVKDESPPLLKEAQITEPICVKTTQSTETEQKASSREAEGNISSSPSLSRQRSLSISSMLRGISNVFQGIELATQPGLTQLEGESSHVKGADECGGLGLEDAQVMRIPETKGSTLPQGPVSMSPLHKVHFGELDYVIPLKPEPTPQEMRREDKRRPSQLQNEAQPQIKEQINDKEGATQSDASCHMQEEAQEQIRELTIALQVKEEAIQSAEAEIEDEKRKLSLLKRESTVALQVKEVAIQYAEDENRKSSQRHKEAQAQIRELTTRLQVKEDGIQNAKDENRKLSQRHEEAQAQIRELTTLLQVKEDAVEEEKRRSSRLQSELTVELEVKEAAIQSTEAEVEEVRRRSSRLQRELTAALRVKETAIQSIKMLQEKLREAENQIAKLLNEEGGDTPSNISKKAWNIPRSQIQGISKQEIGHGAWGMVYSGTFQQELVAIKCAHKDLLHTTTIDMLKREVMIMANIQHPNLVRFVGAVFDNAVERGRDTPIILSELMDMNLRTAYKKKNLSSSGSLISIFRDVAYALHYLHQHRHPIIHRDVSAPNVLLKSLRSGDYQAKVSDFGSANLVKQSTTAGAGAIVYCAPEMFPNEDIAAPPQPQTTKVDVFSYGILMLEVIVREIPNPATRYTMLQQVKDKCQRELIIQCTKPLPSDRPAMTGILDSLHKIHQL